MQKERKKQAKNPFGVMKKEEEERRKKEGEEKQELEFAEGFRRINYEDGHPKLFYINYMENSKYKRSTSWTKFRLW